MSKRTYTPDEDRILAENYQDMLPREIAAIIGRSSFSVRHRLRLLGLCLTEEQQNQRKAIGHANVLNKGVRYRFQKGHVPFNAGSKGLIKPNSGSFKKGHTPANVKFDGAERLTKDGYLLVRVSLADWQLKHRLVWEKANGPVPSGYNIIFIDGNKQNCALENLRMLSNAELMASNTIINYPEELRTAFHRIKKLKRTIKNYEEHKH